MECTASFSPDTAEMLSALVELNLDSARAFKLAAEHVGSRVAAHTLRVYADSRTDMAHELRSLLAASRHGPPAGRSRAAAARRWWTGIRGVSPREAEHELLASAEREETEIRDHYERAMDATLGQRPVHDVLVRQFGNARRIHNRIRALRHAR